MKKYYKVYLETGWCGEDNTLIVGLGEHCPDNFIVEIVDELAYENYVDYHSSDDDLDDVIGSYEEITYDEMVKYVDDDCFDYQDY